MKCKDEGFISKITLFMIVNMIHDFNRCKEESLKNECYSLVYGFVMKNKNKISYKDDYYKYLLDCIKEKDYGTRWFDKALDYETRLQSHAEQFLDLLKSSKYITLWGVGKRGEAFINICNKYGIDNLSLIDQRFEENGDGFWKGYCIIDEETAFLNSDLLVLSNHKIKEVIKTKKNIKVMNLEDYC